jgi:hypothetical protein
MQGLARQRKAPRNIVLPQPVDIQKLFALDVDDEIWQDVGLDEDDCDGTVPLWLEDTDTREGIKHLLTLDRCLEEEVRLRKERTSLQGWVCEEWHALQTACALTSASTNNWIVINAETWADVSPDTTYQLGLRRKELLGLCQAWRATVHVIPSNDPSSDLWGPSLKDIFAGDDINSVPLTTHPVHVDWSQTQSGHSSDEDSDEGTACMSDADDNAESEGDLLDEAESVAFTDLYHHHFSLSDEF